LNWDFYEDLKAGIRHEADCAKGNFKWGMLSLMLQKTWATKNKECFEFILSNITRTFGARYGCLY